MKKFLVLLLAFTMLAPLALAQELIPGEYKPPVVREGQYPIAQKNAVLKYWMPISASATSFISSYAENPAYRKLQQDTGVTIEFIHPAAGSATTESFQTMLMSGQLPDMIQMTADSWYSGGLKAMYDDGAIIDLAPYLAEYAPQYNEVIHHNGANFLAELCVFGEQHLIVLLELLLIPLHPGIFLHQLPDALRHTRRLIMQPRGSLIKFCGIKGFIQRFATGCQDRIFLRKHLPHDLNESFFQCLLCYMRRCAFCFASVLVVAAPDRAPVFIRAVADLAAIKRATISTNDYIDVNAAMLEKMYHKRLKGYASIGYSVLTEQDTGLGGVVIYDQVTFQSRFLQDVAQARESVLIFSPFAAPRRVQWLAAALEQCAQKRIPVTVVMRSAESLPEHSRRSAQIAVEGLKSQSCSLIFRSDIHQKYAIIDDRIVWYGSINLLSFGSSQESMMRLVSGSIAQELMKTEAFNENH